MSDSTCDSPASTPSGDGGPLPATAPPTMVRVDWNLNPSTAYGRRVLARAHRLSLAILESISSLPNVKSATLKANGVLYIHVGELIYICRASLFRESRASYSDVNCAGWTFKLEAKNFRMVFEGRKQDVRPEVVSDWLRRELEYRYKADLPGIKQALKNKVKAPPKLRLIPGGRPA